MIYKPNDIIIYKKKEGGVIYRITKIKEGKGKSWKYDIYVELIKNYTKHDIYHDSTNIIFTKSLKVGDTKYIQKVKNLNTLLDKIMVEEL